MANAIKKWQYQDGFLRREKRGIEDYLRYFGQIGINKHLDEKVPYMISYHDCIAKKGKVSNIQKRVLTIVIGEKDEYKDILAANYDGSLGGGSYEEAYHHIGFDIEAEHIYNAILQYDQNNPIDRTKWKEAYWIVGYGTGGSVANLVAKKLRLLLKNILILIMAEKMQKIIQ